MSTSKKVLKHLDDKKVKYEIVPHKKVYTAFDAAATLKVKLDEIAKSLVVKADKNYYLLILASDKNVNLSKLKKALKAKKVVIPKEAELIKAFKIKPGSLTGFGSIHKVEVILDKGFDKVKKVIFSGGSLVESIKMTVNDYKKLEEPIVHLFSEIKKIKRKGAKTAKAQKRRTTKKPKRKNTKVKKKR